MNSVYIAKPLRNAFKDEKNKIALNCIVNQLKIAWSDFWEAFTYVLTPRVAKPIPPKDPPEPANQTIDDYTLIQCKEIYERIEEDHKYLDEKARSIFGIITFLSPTLIPAISFLVVKSNRHGFMWEIAILGIAFMLLLLGFISTVRALAVQNRDVLFLESVINSDSHEIRPYSKVWHAQGLLYCASVNSAYNAHIAQCVRSAHILTTLAVIITTTAAIPLIMNLEVKTEEINKEKSINSIAETINETTLINLKINKIQADLAEIKATINLAERIQAVDAQLYALHNKINLLFTSKISERQQKTGSIAAN